MRSAKNQVCRVSNNGCPYLSFFLPAFVFSGPLIPRLRRSPAAGAFLDGVNAASLALMAVVMIQRSQAAFVDPPTIAVGSTAALLLLRYKANSVWPVLGGMLAGMLIHAMDLNAWLRI